MKRLQFFLRTKLILSFLGVIVLGGILSLIFGARLIRDTLLSQAQAKVRNDLSSAWMVFDEKLGDVKDIVRLTAARESISEALRGGRKDVLLRYLSRVRAENGLDVLNLLDEKGRVFLRVRSPGASGDDLSKNPLVRFALERRTVAGARIVPREELLGEDESLAAQALLEFIPTPKAAPREERRETSGLMLQAAAPVIAADGALVGALTGGILLNRTCDIVDRIKGIVFRDERYKDRETGTATIFQYDLRISTNVKTEAGERAIGTRLSEEVKRAVLDEGKPYLGRAFVVNDWYLTAYEPIRDIESRIIGILYVGTLEKPFLDTAARVLRTFTVIAALCTLFLLALLYASTTRIVRPLQRMALATRQIAKGDLSHVVDVKSGDEIGQLADSFNRMTSELRAANEELVHWGKTLEKKVEERTRELRDIQEHLIQAEKLASIGKLAAGVAHEINNPLGGILIYSHLILEDTPKTGPHYENLKKIVKETTRCKDIVKGLLEFARPKEPEMVPTDIHDLLEKCLALMERHPLFQNIHLQTTFAPGLPRIVADGGQLQQVFMNIILNAAEAMNGNGTLILKTWVDPAREEIAVEFTDTGHGIKDEDKKRLFEPFFTTKEVGKGTGLGLAISYGIIQKHRGDIEIRSEAGRGATFIVRLPLKEKSA